VLKSAVTKSNRLHPLMLNKLKKKINAAKIKKRCRAHERLALLLLYWDAALLLLYSALPRGTDVWLNCCFKAPAPHSTARLRH
jgi:hypothetical protein